MALKKPLLLLFLVLVLIGGYLLWKHRAGVPEEFADAEHFKYGSIGADNLLGGLPYWIWRVLPEMFPQYLPQNGKRGYEAFGLVVEPGKDRPIGFSKRTFWNFYVTVGPNCAFCHVSTIRRTADGPPETILGMPGHTVDIENFFLFLFRTARNSEFTVLNVMRNIATLNPDMGFIQKMVYPVVILFYRMKIGSLAQQYDFLETMPEFGPGRVETWTPYKRTVVKRLLPVTDAGIADFPALWNQRLREKRHDGSHMQLHWDGNNDDLNERNIIAAVGVTGTRHVDIPRLLRVKQFIMDLRPPSYEEKLPEGGKFSIKQELAKKGEGIYGEKCAACHALSGEKVGKVEALAAIGTDRSRADAFTPELVKEVNQLKDDSWRLRTPPAWTLKNFKKTDGYTNQPLDGVWLRAPYLHNGSVPTLRDLLKRPEERPKIFFRGNDVYDWVNVGFKSDDPGEQGRTFFCYNTAEKGNSNQGHAYGTDLSEDQKDALVEYLKTL
jgi:hypothetical protein